MMYRQSYRWGKSVKYKAVIKENQSLSRRKRCIQEKAACRITGTDGMRLGEFFRGCSFTEMKTGQRINDDGMCRDDQMHSKVT